MKTTQELGQTTTKIKGQEQMQKATIKAKIINLSKCNPWHIDI